MEINIDKFPEVQENTLNKITNIFYHHNWYNHKKYVVIATVKNNKGACLKLYGKESLDKEVSIILNNSINMKYSDMTRFTIIY